MEKIREFFPSNYRSTMLEIALFVFVLFLLLLVMG